jgi:hypothetical protein
MSRAKRIDISNNKADISAFLAECFDTRNKRLNNTNALVFTKATKPWFTAPAVCAHCDYNNSGICRKNLIVEKVNPMGSCDYWQYTEIKGK